MVLNNWQAVWDLLPLSPRSYLLCSERLAHACYVRKVSEYATWSAVVPLTPAAPRRDRPVPPGSHGDVNLVYTNYWLASLPDAEGSP